MLLYNYTLSPRKKQWEWKNLPQIILPPKGGFAAKNAEKNTKRILCDTKNAHRCQKCVTRAQNDRLKVGKAIAKRATARTMQRTAPECGAYPLGQSSEKNRERTIA
ncbi:MAG TPA: hypothetical protein IAC72_02790 [Candidatus Fimimonas merdipullorum]|uniref:Uncharacterized protein n=1 Tax=Candidatus Fimimonas merdipullorum TaxID=2840822 RepID=A0A9D1SPS7_9BACT|nr:hypothetical protein [Candidatus Fimimonas merdipullorum]